MAKHHVAELLGQPVETATELIDLVNNRVLAPGDTPLLYSSVGWRIAQHPRVMAALLSNEGTTLHDSIEILHDAFYQLHDHWEKRYLETLTENTREAARLLAGCPEQVRRSYGVKFAKATTEMGPAQLEIFTQLVSDRCDEPVPSDWHTRPRVDLIQEALDLSQILAA